MGPAGTLEPLGVFAGMLLAMVTRATYSARLKGRQSLDWRRVSRMSRGLVPRSQEEKSTQRARPGFEGGVNKDGFDEQYGHLPGQLVCGVADG